LIDVIKKKVDYLKILISELGLNNAKAYNASQEKTPSKVDTLTCRALGSLKKIVELSKPYLIREGKILAYKGTKDVIEQELKELPPFIKSEVSLLKPPLMLEAQRHIITLTFS
jgi:16S rRNA (guanine527-N7)-methyltransferase